MTPEMRVHGVVVPGEACLPLDKSVAGLWWMRFEAKPPYEPREPEVWKWQPGGQCWFRADTAWTARDAYAFGWRVAEPALLPWEEGSTQDALRYARCALHSAATDLCGVSGLTVQDDEVLDIVREICGDAAETLDAICAPSVAPGAVHP